MNPLDQIEQAAVTAIAVTVISIIAGILAIAGGIVLYFTVFSKKNEGKYTGFLGWLYNFVHFNTLMVEPIMKITYLIGAISVTLTSFTWFPILGGLGFFAFLLQIVFGNVLLRLFYEMVIMLVIIARNLNEINAKMKGASNGANSQFSSSIIPAAAEKNAAPAKIQQPEQSAAPAAPVNDTWTCECGMTNASTANFCKNCGKPKNS